jgi:hypothetical protein
LQHFIKSYGYENKEKVTNDTYTEQSGSLDTKNIEQFINELNSDTAGYIPNLDFNSFINIFKTGVISYIGKDILTGLLRYFLSEVLLNTQLLVKLIVLTIFIAIVKLLMTIMINTR